MKNKTNDVWLFLEQDSANRVCKASLEMLTPAMPIAKRQGGKLVGIIIGSDASHSAEAAAHYPFDLIICIQGEEYAQFSHDAFTHAFCTLAEKYAPRTVMFSATAQGREFAPRVACRLETGLTADCTELSFDEENQCTRWTGPAFGGSLLAAILCCAHRPEMGTLRPGVFDPPPASNTECAEIIYEDISFPAEKIRTKLLESIPDPDAESDRLEEAEIVVCGGRGAGKAGFELIAQLADALGGVVGATRVATDLGWACESRQIGQTGKAIRPKLYIACGVSGAIQHLIGVNDKAVTVAMNTDPDAPIMKAADYAVCGDMFEVLPRLIDLIKSK